MNETQAKFLQTLFDPGQHSCFTPVATGFSVTKEPTPADVYFCINALDGYMDRGATKSWHRILRPRRADCNVECFRNFLLEIDTEPLAVQRSLVESKLPVTSVVYSGKQSYHFIISLEEPLATIEEYRALARRLMRTVPQADPSTKNPSRLSRLPGVLRPDSGQMQTLVRLDKRVPLSVLEAALVPEPKATRRQKVDPISHLTPALLVGAISKPDEYMLEYNLGGRNAFFFWLGQRMNDLETEPTVRAEMVRVAYSNLRSVADFSLQEAYMAARVQA